MNDKESLEGLHVDKVPLEVIPVTNYDPFEAKFCSSLYWLVFRATEDSGLDDIPPQITSPIQRDDEHRITIRPEVIDFLTNGEVYGKVCDAIFHNKDPIMGHWAVIQALARHGFYVVEDGDIAVTDSALQQTKPFRKSTHLALMDGLMAAYSSQVVTVQQVVQAVRKFASFSASKELPFDLEDSLLLWINKVCASLNESHLKKQKLYAEQLLNNQDKAKRFRFRRDQLQPKVHTLFPVIDDLLKDLSDGQCLLGVVMFYHPDSIKIEEVNLGKKLSTVQIVANVELFRSLCSQHMCTSVLSLRVEDIMYASQAMKPNLLALLAEMFFRCELDDNTLNEGTKQRCHSVVSGLAGEERISFDPHMNIRSSSAPMLASDIISAASPALARRLSGAGQKGLGQDQKESPRKSTSETEILSRSRKSSYSSSLQLDFTTGEDNGPHKQKEKESTAGEVDATNGQNPFSGIFQKPMLARDSRKNSAPSALGGTGSPRLPPRGEPRLIKRAKQKPRTLALEDWEMTNDETEDLHVTDLQRSQSLTGLDRRNIEPRQSFHAWQEGSSSENNLTAGSTRPNRISLEFKPTQSVSSSCRLGEAHKPGQKVLTKAQEDFMSQDSLYSSSPKSCDSLNAIKPTGISGKSSSSGVAESFKSDASARELTEFEEMEAMIIARGSASSVGENKVKPKSGVQDGGTAHEDDLLNASVSSDDMNRFRLEVLQRLTEDKIRSIDFEREKGAQEATQKAASDTAGQVQNAPMGNRGGEVEGEETELLSPITETTEPGISLPESLSSGPPSHPSTAPSSPCSPLEIAEFMPAFFMTSPANTMDKKKYKKGSVEKSVSLTVENSDKAGVTRREKVASRSFEQMLRGSYTVDHITAAAAKAAGIPVIDNRVLVSDSHSMRESRQSRDDTLVESTRTQGGSSTQANASDGSTCSREFKISGEFRKESPDSLENSPSDIKPNFIARVSQAPSPGTPDDVVIYDRKSTEKMRPEVDAQPLGMNRSRDSHVIDATSGESQEACSRLVHKNKPENLVFDFNPRTLQAQYDNDVRNSYSTVSNEVQRASYAGGNPPYPANQTSTAVNQTEAGQFDDDEELPARTSENAHAGAYLNDQGLSTDEIDASHVRGDKNSYGTYNKHQTTESPRQHLEKQPNSDLGRFSTFRKGERDFPQASTSGLPPGDNDQARYGTCSSHQVPSPRQQKENQSSTDLGRFSTFRKGEKDLPQASTSGLPPGDHDQARYGTHNSNQAPSPRQREENQSSSDLGRFSTFRKGEKAVPTSSLPPGDHDQTRYGAHNSHQAPSLRQREENQPSSDLGRFGTFHKGDRSMEAQQAHRHSSYDYFPRTDGNIASSPRQARKQVTSVSYSDRFGIPPDVQRLSSPLLYQPPESTSYPGNATYRPDIGHGWNQDKPVFNQANQVGIAGHPRQSYYGSEHPPYQSPRSYPEVTSQGPGYQVTMPSGPPGYPNVVAQNNLYLEMTSRVPGYQSPRSYPEVTSQGPSYQVTMAQRSFHAEVTSSRHGYPEMTSQEPKYQQNDSQPNSPTRKPEAFTVDMTTGQVTEASSSGDATSPRSPGSSIVRSRTFRKRPEGKVFEPDVMHTSDQRADNVMSPRVSEQEPAVVLRRKKDLDSQGGRSQDIHRISWSDATSNGLPVAPGDTDLKGKRETVVLSPRRRTGRSSPGARISWLTAGKTGFGGQVMLNDRELEDATLEDQQAQFWGHVPEGVRLERSGLRVSYSEEHPLPSLCTQNDLNDLYKELTLPEPRMTSRQSGSC